MATAWKSNSLGPVLEFPQGRFLVFGSGYCYFQPQGHADAYQVYGEHKEFMGKHHFRGQTRAADFKTFDLTWEFEDNVLIAARLISPAGRWVGSAPDAAGKQAVGEALDRGAIALHDFKSPTSIDRVAQMPDGQLLVAVYNHPEHDHYFLMIGKPGAYRDYAKLALQGGSHFIFKTAQGDTIDMPGQGGWKNESPKFNDTILTYLPVKDGYDLAAFGLSFPALAPHLDPFCPELATAPAPKTLPKPTQPKP